MILPIFPILLFYNCSVLLCDFTQMAAVTSLRLSILKILKERACFALRLLERGSWGVLHLQRAFFLRSLYDLKNEEYRNRKTKKTEKNKLQKSKQPGKNRKIGRIGES